MLDSGSTDQTVSIARRYTHDVYQTDWPGYGAQRNRALQKCDGEWVLSIDADERMSAALKADIDRILCESGLDATLLKLPWRTWLFGRPLQFGRYTAPQAKLFKREGARYREHRVHESLILPRRVTRTVRPPLDHRSWRDYQHLQHKHLQYACLLARQKADAGQHSGLRYACLRFFTDFVQQYVLRLGFLDGRRGFLIAIVLGQYAFHKYAALAMAGIDQPAAGQPRNQLQSTNSSCVEASMRQPSVSYVI